MDLNVRSLPPLAADLTAITLNGCCGARACVRLACSGAAVPPRRAMNILETHSLKTDSRIGLAKMEGLLNSVLGRRRSSSTPLCTAC